MWLKEAGSNLITQDVKNIKLECEFTEAPLRHFYSDERMIGKHFRVAWVGNDQKVSRHYTICNVMEPT